MRTALFVFALALPACGGSPAGNTNLDLGVDMSVDRSADVPLTFEPGGLWWDSATQSLYLADDGGQQIIRWEEQGDHFDVFARLPSIDPKFGGLGQLVKTSDGSWYVTRFGATAATPATQAASAILRVAPDGTVSQLPLLDPHRRRIGLAVDADGMTLYDGWFIGKAAMNMGSGISKVSLTAGETDLVTMPATMVEKPVGVVALGGNIYFSDELGGAISKFAIAVPGTPTTFATIDQPDALALGPSGTIFAVTGGGSVYQVASGGTATQLKSGYRALRGVAYDPDHKRLFFVEPDGNVPDSGTPMPMLHIIAVE